MSKISVANSGVGRLNLIGGVSLDPGTMGPNGVLVEPGVTLVDAEAWDKCKEHHLTKHYLSTRRVSVVGPTPAAPKPPAAPLAGVSELTAKEAIAYVAGCEDVAELRSSWEDEKRVTVIAALEKRLDELAGDPEDDDVDGSDDSEDYDEAGPED